MKTQEKNTEHMLAMPDLSFPWRLFLLLKYAEEEQLEQIITWTRGGKAFQVHNHEEFERTLLPKYFKMSKYASFTRQLCAYGFSCIRRGRQKGLCKFENLPLFQVNAHTGHSLSNIIFVQSFTLTLSGMTQMGAFKFQEKQKRIQKPAVLRKITLHQAIMPRRHRRLLP